MGESFSFITTFLFAIFLYSDLQEKYHSVKKKWEIPVHQRIDMNHQRSTSSDSFECPDHRSNWHGGPISVTQLRFETSLQSKKLTILQIGAKWLMLMMMSHKTLLKCCNVRFWSGPERFLGENGASLLSFEEALKQRPWPMSPRWP